MVTPSKALKKIREFQQNLKQKLDPINIYYINYWVFVFCGFWTYKPPTKRKAQVYELYRLAVKVIYSVSVVFFIIDAIMVRHDIHKLAFNMSSTALVAMKLIQFILFVIFQLDLVKVYDKLDHHLHVDSVGSSEEDLEIIRQKAEKILSVTLTFYILLIIGMPLRIMADTIFGTNSYLIPLPFREAFDPYYILIYAQQAVVCMHFMTATLSYDLLGFTYLVRFIGHFEILEKNLHKIKFLYPVKNYEKYVGGYVSVKNEEEDVLIRKTNYLEKKHKFLVNHNLRRYNIVGWVEREEKTFQLLKQNLNHHQKLLAEFNNFIDVYGVPLLIQAVGMMILVSIVVLQMIFLSSEMSPLFLQQLLYSITTILNIVYLGSYGSELFDKSISAANALYDTPWFEMSLNNRFVVYLIMKKLIHAPKVKATGLITIDRVLCVKIFQFSYNMVALLRNKM